MYGQVEIVLSSSRRRMDISDLAIHDLNESLLDTNDALRESRQLISRSDRLIQRINCGCFCQNWSSGKAAPYLPLPPGGSRRISKAPGRGRPSPFLPPARESC